MNKYFFFCLFVFTYLFAFKLINIPIFGVHLILSSVTIYILPFITVLFIYWKIRDINLNKANALTLLFRKHIRQYLERNGAAKKDNLLDDFPNQIYPTQDLYMINGKLIMQTENKSTNSGYSPGGYILALSRISIYWLYFTTALKIIFEYEFFSDFILILWGVTLIFALIAKIIYQMVSVAVG